MKGRLIALAGICLFLLAAVYTDQFRSALETMMANGGDPASASENEESYNKGQDSSLPTLKEFLRIKKLPRQYGMHTRLMQVDHLASIKTVKLTYHVSMASKKASKAKLSWQRINKPEQINLLLKTDCNNPAVQQLLNDGYKLIHSYYSARGKSHEYSFTLNKKKCREWQYPGKPERWASGIVELRDGAGSQSEKIKSFGPKESKSKIITVQ
jgi:hypothetical protein